MTKLRRWMTKLRRWMTKLRRWWNFRPLKPIKESILREIRNGCNILLIGGPGTGKSFFMKELGNKHIRDPSYLYRNADIDDVRLPPMIRDFCSIPLDGPETVFVDDADAMTNDIQRAIARLIDEYGTKTVFVFAANSIERISQPIRSRCVIYPFNVKDGRRL